jgi:hypothetical protein
VRVIKSDDCPICRSYVSRLRKENFAFEMMDGDADENQTFLDEWNITEYPVVQILNDQGKVLHSFPKGTWSPRAIRAKMKGL